MIIDIKPMQHLFLWRLAVGGGEEFLANLPALKPVSHRTALTRAGLITEGKRPNPAAAPKKKAKPPKTPKKPVAVKYYALTDQGWAWCQANMTWPAKVKSPQAGKILELLLPRLHAVWQRGEAVASLGDLVSKTSAPPSEPAPSVAAPTVPAPPKPDVHQAIRTACKSLANGQEAVRIRLADLRGYLIDFNKDEVTQGLWDLSATGELSLYRLDDPREIQPADHDAAVRTSTGEEKHIVYFGGVRS